MTDTEHTTSGSNKEGKNGMFRSRSVKKEVRADVYKGTTRRIFLIYFAKILYED